MKTTATNAKKYNELTADEQKQAVNNLNNAKRCLARATLGKAMAKSALGQARAEKQVEAALAAHTVALAALA